MHKFTRLLMLMLGASLLCSGLTLPIAAEPAESVDPYTQSLIDKGFPASYAEKLTELHVQAAPETTTEEITTEAPTEPESDTTVPTEENITTTPDANPPTGGCKGMVGTSLFATLALVGMALFKKKK